ncbi:MAG: response regulator [Vicinamibacterales bacterium]|nr:response regulator [Vicinamibacterales bacterium]
MGRRFLEKAGYGCVEADSIEAALEALRTTPVVAAILDVRLPGAHSGLDMLVAFREIEEFRTIPILIMTGSLLTEIEQATITKHRAVLFYKPEGFSTIVGFLDQLTGRDRSH